jgi:TM2 domain-containing membrane protein YozV
MDDPGSRRRQTIALVLSGIFPGLGQFYNRQLVKGGLSVILAGVLSWLIGRAMPAEPLALVHPGAALVVPTVVLLAFWLWSIIDAWRVAGQ